MAVYDIGLETTAILQLDARNPFDKLVFNLTYLLDGAVIKATGKMNRSQIMSYFNVMSITGKVNLILPESSTEILHRLMWGRGTQVNEVELLTKTRFSVEYESGSLSRREISSHPPLVVAFMKASDAKIVDIVPVRTQNKLFWNAVFDSS